MEGLGLGKKYSQWTWKKFLQTQIYGVYSVLEFFLINDYNLD